MFQFFSSWVWHQPFLITNSICTENWRAVSGVGLQQGQPKCCASAHRMPSVPAVAHEGKAMPRNRQPFIHSPERWPKGRREIHGDLQIQKEQCHKCFTKRTRPSMLQQLVKYLSGLTKASVRSLKSDSSVWLLLIKLGCVEMAWNTF